MGLSIGYEFRASASLEEARELVRRLHKRAVKMGLCRLPAKARRSIDGRSVEFDTGLGDIWAWQSSCKTQYASDPQNGGIECFLDSHIRLIELLDFARNLRILHDVGDDGGYWLHRDRQKLTSEIHRWNVKVAGVVGALNDLFEEEGKQRGVAPITGFPDFERHEAEARRNEEVGGDS